MQSVSTSRCVTADETRKSDLPKKRSFEEIAEVAPVSLPPDDGRDGISGALADANDLIDQTLHTQNHFSGEDEDDLLFFGADFTIVCEFDIVLGDELIDIGESSTQKKVVPNRRMFEFKSTMNIPAITEEELAALPDFE
jgi:hypothetical protein